MLLLAVVLVPIVLGLAAFATPSPRARAWLVPAGALLHAGLTALVIARPEDARLDGWLILDPLGRVLLGTLSLQFLVCSFYVPGYLGMRSERPNRVFCAALLFFIGTMSLAVVAHHLGLMWVGIETTTLSSAPLLYFNRNARSLEAVWKYLLVGSVGIALALFGSFFLAYAALQSGQGSSLLFEDLVRHAGGLSKPWLHTAYVVLFVGYGTKMGLAPMHTWKPDAYGEAPGLVGALMAGGLTSCAFLALLRIVQICSAAGEGPFARQILLVMGLLSMAVAAVFMARQRDYKRLLAYSSVEHMGILVFGVGLGGLGTFGALLHMVNNSLGKGTLFLTAGNIHRAYGSKSTADVTGALRYVPISAGVFFAGFFAITASPPFGLFISELTILKASFSSGRYVEGSLFLVFIAIVFMGMGATVVRIVQGVPPEAFTGKRYHEPFLTVAPPLCFLLLVLVLGIWIPAPLSDALHAAADFVEVK